MLVRELPEEILIYDLTRHKMFCLGKNASWVWRRCNGRRTARELAASLEKELRRPVPEDVLALVLRRLSRARLLENPVERPPGEVSRRELLRTAAAIGGVSILALAVPTPMAAATCTRGVITPSECDPGDATSWGCCCTNGQLCDPSGMCVGASC